MSNNATNFQAAVAENLQTVFLGSGHFSEVVTWWDDDQAVGRTVTVMEVTAAGNLELDPHHRATSRKIHLAVTNDAVLGTTSPATGIRIKRADNTVWGFRRIVDEAFDAFTLEFEGGQLDRVGSGRQGHL